MKTNTFLFGLWALGFGLCACHADNWTNYPAVTTPNTNDTLLIAHSATPGGALSSNRQWRIDAMLQMTKSNANVGQGDIVTHGTNEFQGTNGIRLYQEAVWPTNRIPPSTSTTTNYLFTSWKGRMAGLYTNTAAGGWGTNFLVTTNQ